MRRSGSSGTAPSKNPGDREEAHRSNVRQRDLKSGGRRGFNSFADGESTAQVPSEVIPALMALVLISVIVVDNRGAKFALNRGEVEQMIANREHLPPLAPPAASVCAASAACKIATRL